MGVGGDVGRSAQGEKPREKETCGGGGYGKVEGQLAVAVGNETKYHR